MLIWTLEASRGYTYHKASLHGGSPLELGQALDSLLTRLCEHVIPVHDEAAWNCIRVEVWPSSGRLIVFPAVAESQRRNERAACELRIDSLLSLFDSLDFEDPAASRRLRRSVARLAETLMQVWRKRPVVGAYYQVPVRFHESDTAVPFLSDEIPSSLLGLAVPE